MDTQAVSSPDGESCQCLAPPKGKGPGRNLVVCIDGTSNQFGPKNTNVIELYSQLVKDDNQLTYYNSGIGTYAKPSWRSLDHWKQILYHKIDLAIAWNFEKIIMGAYRWLADNYRDGDRIFLFGFSRGAYQVRTLAGMIHKVGLIYKGNEEQIPFAYELYADPSSDGTKSRTRRLGLRIRYFSSKQNQQLKIPVDLAKRFKDTFSRRHVRVHFTGVWDTVSSIGVIRGKDLPGTVSLDHTCFFRHALSLDERRVKFLPEYACGGVMENDQSRGPSPRVKEVWFPGTHSDIGGGNVLNNDLDRRHPAFLWMTYEATSAHLNLNTANAEWKWDELGHVHESLTTVWKLFEYLPFKRLSYEDSTSHTWCWHRGQGRKIQPGQKIHASVAFCTKYYPKAPFPSDKKHRNWDELVGSGKNFDMKWTQGWEDLLEMDIFDASMVHTVIQQIEALVNPTVWVHRLTVMTWSAEGCETLREVDQAAHRLVRSIPKLIVEVRIPVANAITEFTAYHSDFPVLPAMLRECKDWDSTGQFFHDFICDAKASSAKLTALKKIAKDDDLRSEMLASNVAVALLAKLADEDQGVRQSAHNFFMKLVEYDDSRCTMFDSNVSAPLLARLKDSDPGIRMSSLNVLTKLAEHNDLQHNIWDSDAVAALLSRLGDDNWTVFQSAVECVTKLAEHDDPRRKILECNVVAALLTRLGDQDWMIRQCVIDCVTALTQYDISRRSMLDSNIFPNLFAWLGDDDPGIRMSSLNVLTILMEHDDLKHKMLDSDAVVALMDRLRDENWAVFQLSVNFITKLAPHDHLRHKILECGVITALIPKLRNKDWMVCQCVLHCVTGLAQYDDSCRSIMESDMITVLLASFGYQIWAVQLLVVNLIVKLTEHDDFRRKILDSGIVASLLVKLGDQTWIVRQSVVGLVSRLLEHDDSFLKMSDSNIIIALLDRLTDRIRKVRQPVHDIIVRLAQHEKKDDSRFEMLDSNVFANLLAGLRDDDQGVRLSNLKSIGQLVKHDDLRSKILHPDIFTALQSRLRDGDNVVRRNSLNLIVELAGHDGSRCMMLDSDMITTILAMLGEEISVVRLSVVNCIMVLVQYDDACRKMLECNIVAALLSGLGNSDQGVRLSSLRIIGKLSELDEFRGKMLESHVMTTIQERCHVDPVSTVQQAALHCVVKLVKISD